MIAIILIGGAGTRLRPFTLDFPKPLLPVVNRPFLEYQFDILKRHGIREVVLCAAYKPELFHRVLGDGRKFGMRLHYVHEKTPLGTGGAVKNAQDWIKSTALILNGDVLHDLDVSAFLKSHRQNRAEASIALVRVKDPTRYGLIETETGGRVRRFLEKPSWDEVSANTVNAGAYLFEPSVAALIPPRVNHSLERVLFPKMLEMGARLFGIISHGYWVDIGTIEKFLQVHFDILGGSAPTAPPPGLRRGKLHAEAGTVLGKNLLFEGHSCRVVLGYKTHIGDGVRFLRRVCIGPGCRIGRGTTLEDCVILEGCVIGE